MIKSPTTRFSDRVEHYARYRPGYPPEVIELMRRECGLKPSHFVADIASGTGLFTRLLLENGNSVYSVEPNPEMREMGDLQLATYDRLVSVLGTAVSFGGLCDCGTGGTLVRPSTGAGGVCADSEARRLVRADLE